MTSIVSYEVIQSSPNVPTIIRDSTGAITASSDPDKLLSFLRYSHSGIFRVFWDLDEAIAPLLKLLPLPVLESLSRFDENTMYGGHQLYYLPERLARIGRSRFYGIKQFWPTDTEPPSSLEELQSRAEELISTLADCGMPDPAKLTSPIAVWEATELGKAVYSTIPKGYNLPRSVWEALEYAYRCDRREWITAYQIGSWGVGEIYDFDKTSCYPGVASELLDICDMDLWKSDDYSRREQGAYYGFLRGHLYLDPDAEYVHCSPIMTDLERMPGNPAGDFGDDYYLTLDELRFIERYGLGEFKLCDGWFMSPSGGVRPAKPFHDIMHQLYQSRSRSDLAASVMKGVANQLIGKLIETRVDGNYGDLRNDIYHAIVLSQSRVKVAEFLVQNEVKKNELVTVQTDGCRVTRNISVRGSGMGSWRANGSQPTIVASPYKVYIGGKKPGHLTYDYITTMIADHPRISCYSRTVKQRVTLRQALQQDNISLVGKLDDLPARLDLNAIPREQNRDFPKFPITGQSLLSGKYQSSPMILPQ